MTSYFEQRLATQDLYFQLALAEAETLYHQGESGARFEDKVREIAQGFLPGSYRARGVLLAGSAHKQLDIAIYPDVVPGLLEELPIELLTATGELKKRLSDKAGIVRTAEKISDAVASASDHNSAAFFVLAGALAAAPSNHLDWLTDLVGQLIQGAMAQHLQPAVFSFDRRGPSSALRVGASTPIRARTRTGDLLEGVLGLDGCELSPSALLYFWLWSVIHTRDNRPGLDYRYLREIVTKSVDTAGGLRVSYRPDGRDAPVELGDVALVLPEEIITSVSLVIQAPSSDRLMPQRRDHEQTGDLSNPGSRFMLISLGPWTPEVVTWDESAWGGSSTATRQGYGYYDGMTDVELLDASRLFWKFNPNSSTWRGIEYALVAHAGLVRAVLKLGGPIGPLGGRWGYHAEIIRNEGWAIDLVGRAVPIRQNPITSIEI